MLTISALLATTLSASAKPNILIITADNLGYGDLKIYNPDSPILAPNLERLAAEGTVLTDFYTASPTCTVSRACLLTGRIPQHHGLQHQLVGVEENYGPMLNKKEILISQAVKPAGYTTACFGKWNVGFAPGYRPTERGFDEFLGNVSGNIDYYTHIYGGHHDLYRGTEEAYLNGYSTDLFADAAATFIRKHEGQPWLCYLPFNAPHFPNAKNKALGQPVIWQAPVEAFERYGCDPGTRDEVERYRAVVTALDDAIGRVLQALDETGQADNTFLFFMSDNGAFMLPGRGLEVSTNAPLRDGGVTCWEGGIRVAALARWPGQIPAGAKVSAPLWSPDLLAACATLAGTKMPEDRVMDGKNPLPVLTGETNQSPHDTLLFTYKNHAALRKGDWKIVRTQPEDSWQLFNLAEDVSESKDRSGEHPEKVKELAEAFSEWDKGFTE